MVHPELNLANAIRYSGERTSGLRGKVKGFYF
jgi:hypothetical protein